MRFQPCFGIFLSGDKKVIANDPKVADNGTLKGTMDSDDNPLPSGNIAIYLIYATSSIANEAMMSDLSSVCSQ